MSFGNYSSSPKPNKPVLPAKEKKLKMIFDNPEHVWAHPLAKDGSGFAQTFATNTGKNFYFKTADDKTRVMYSYRDSYPIGALFTHKKKQVFLIRSGKAYSVTTAGHMQRTSLAVPSNAICFDVPYVTYDNYSNWKDDAEMHVLNVKDYISRINEEIRTASKGLSLYTIESSLEQAKKLIIELKAYAKMFDIKTGKLPVVPTLTKDRKDKAKAFDDNAETRRISTAAKKQANREASREESRRWHLMTDDEKIAKWREGTLRNSLSYSFNNGYAMLRVKGSNVETSQGVTVPILGHSGAKRLLAFLQDCYTANRTYIRNGHSEHIGNFVAESFGPQSNPEDTRFDNPNGEWILVAGCHKILWSEIQSIAEQVNAFQDGE